MSYQVPPPKEPSGCLQTVAISRMMAQILAIPLLLICGGLIFVSLGLYAFSIHFIVGFAAIAFAIGLLVLIARWEYTRAKRGLPPPDEIDRIDPRMR